MDLIRDSIQRHDRIGWIFTGGHHLSELQSAGVDWSSHFVGMRTLEMTPFDAEETHALLIKPMAAAEENNPIRELAENVFNPEFWDNGRAIERIQLETGGWCFFVQAVAANAVRLCNNGNTKVVDEKVTEDALAKTLVSADQVFSQILLERSTEFPEAWAYLKGFRKAEQLPPPEDDELRKVLKRHLLVVETESGELRMRIPLFRRWLIERA